MQLDQTLINRILNIDFLSNVGEKYKDYIVEANVKNVDKHISTLKWENICLDESGDVSGFLAKNHSDKFQIWNDLVKEAKKLLLPGLEEKLNFLIDKNMLTVKIKQDILFNIIGIVVIGAYKEYVKSPFYNELLEIYEAGYIPYGWKGKYPGGSMYVYGGAE